MTLPPDFETRMRARLREQWPAFQLTLQENSPTSIRLNPLKKSKVPEKKIPWTEAGYYLEERPRFTLDPLFHAGVYYVQEASSMLIEQGVRQSMEVTQPIVALDLCAAPGGKSTHLLSLLSPDSFLVSNEVIRARASVLSENIQKWGYENVLVTSNDPIDFQLLPGFFDLIVVDAPCSGEGLFRKDQAAMKEWSVGNVQLCAQRQQRIVADVWPSLKEEGILLYSTCTYSEEENEQNLQWLANNKQVEFVSLKLEASWGVEEVKNGNVLGYRCYPHRVNGEGFFLAIVRKKSHEPAKSFRLKNNVTLISKKANEALHDWMMPHNHTFVQRDEYILSVSTPYLSALNTLFHLLKPVIRGTAVATQKHDKFIPEHALALSVHVHTDRFKKIDLSLEEALAYLRKDVLSVGEGEKGFALVMYEGVPLGWVNLLGNRLNNLYPAGWRIMMRS
ncbi:MAG: rRNA methyltransferase [Chryseotalea sp. WA131a]|nr:MAG: rRNA methyltransferase [Chryseotalea sp. WA131a]